MPITYKVWIEVEECMYDEPGVGDRFEPVDHLGPYDFDSQTQAMRFGLNVQEWAYEQYNQLAPVPDPQPAPEPATAPSAFDSHYL